jgi:Beta-propeller repeat
VHLTVSRRALGVALAVGIIAPMALAGPAAASDFAWTVTVGGVDDQEVATGVAVSGSHVYVVGWNLFEKEGGGNEINAFIKAYELDGTPAWSETIASPVGDDVAKGVVVTSDAVWVTGYTTGALQNGEASSGGQDVFVSKYDLAGGEPLTDQFGSFANDEPTGIAADPSGNVYLAGHTRGTLPSETNQGGLYDGWAQAYTAEGSVSWTEQFGTTSTDWIGDPDAEGASAAVIGPDGFLYLAGSTWGSYPTFTNPDTNDTDTVVLKLDAADGSVDDVFQSEDPGADQALAVTADGGGVYTAGVVRVTSDGRSDTDATLRRFDTSLAPGWLQAVGSTGEDRFMGLVSEGSNLLAVGRTEGLTTVGAYRGLYASFDPAGFENWVREDAGAAQFDSVTADGSVVVAAGTKAGGADGILVRFDREPPNGTVAVNGTAQYTNSRNVTLTLSATDPEPGSGVADMMLYDVPGPGTDWQAYGTSAPLTLSGPSGEKTVYAEFRDGAGNIASPRAEDTITLDLEAPSRPVLGAFARFQTDRRFPVSWSSSDTVSGIKDYLVQYRRAAWNSSAYGAWTSWLPATSATTAQFPGGAGYRYCFRVRARDNALNLSAFSAQRCTSAPVDDRSLSRVGSWINASDPAAYLTTLSETTSGGASLRRTGVVARQLAIEVQRCSTCGYIQVRWNGAVLGTYSLRSTSTLQRQLIQLPRFPSIQTGTLEITSTVAGKPVRLDGVIPSLV